jgi:hypothetical protein
MFSFVKKIQELLEKIRAKKGLFFSILSLTSIFGISLFMYLIMTLTSSIKSDVYESIKNNNNKSLENLLTNKKKLYQDISNIILMNDELLGAIQTNDTNKISNFEKRYNTLYNTNSKTPMNIKFYSRLNTDNSSRNTITNLMRTKDSLFGIETQYDGIYINSILPIVQNGDFIGLIQLRQSIHSLKMYYDKIDNYFVFMLDKKMLVKLSLKAKSGRYVNVTSNFLIKKGNYTSRFYSKIGELNQKEFKLALKHNYDNDDKFYRSYKIVTDINGAEIGLFVFGEDMEKNNGFISLVENVIKTVTYVSLGLVISILMFMF